MTLHRSICEARRLVQDRKRVSAPSVGDKNYNGPEPRELKGNALSSFRWRTGCYRQRLYHNAIAIAEKYWTKNSQGFTLEIFIVGWQSTEAFIPRNFSRTRPMASRLGPNSAIPNGRLHLTGSLKVLYVFAIYCDHWSLQRSLLEEVRTNGCSDINV
jgi:hypothetical protein